MPKPVGGTLGPRLRMLVGLPVLVLAAVAGSGAAGPVPIEPASASAPSSTGGCVVDVADVIAWWKGEDSPAAEVGPPLIGPVGYTDGLDGRALHFVPPDVVTAEGVAAVGSGVTVESWVRLQDNGQTQALVSRWRFAGEDDQRSYALIVVADQLAWLTDETTLRRPVELTAPAPELFDGSFHHVAATWSASEIVLYLDGQVLASMPSQGGVLNEATGTPVYLGSASYAGFFLAGSLDEPTIYDRALTSAEIAAVHAAGPDGKCGGGSTSGLPPRITIAAPLEGSSYGLNEQVLADYECTSEPGSPAVVTCDGTVPDGEPIDTATVGSHLFNVDAADAGSGTSTAILQYDVVFQYVFTGFAEPLDNTAVNAANAGRTIPITWRLTTPDGAPVSDPASFLSVTSGSTTCNEQDPITEVAAYSGSSGLQYLGDGHWQFNWKTLKSYAGQCRIMWVNLADGSHRSARFEFS